VLPLLVCLHWSWLYRICINGVVLFTLMSNVPGMCYRCCFVYTDVECTGYVLPLLFCLHWCRMYLVCVTVVGLFTLVLIVPGMCYRCWLVYTDVECTGYVLPLLACLHLFWLCRISVTGDAFSLRLWGPSWSYCSWIYNYLCNQCLSSKRVSSNPAQARCTQCNIA
jgi:hypothetical protein